jgi:protein associated with RNAse G/E
LELKTIAFKIEVLVSLSDHPSSISIENFEAKNKEPHFPEKIPQKPRKP